jgi:hypothetical protein
MRRTLIPLALALAGALLSSCGKGSTTVTVTAGRAAHSRAPETSTGKRARPPGKGGPGSAPSRRGALAFARAVNLTDGDVPGFTATRKHEGSSSSERQLERQMLSCAGLGGGAHAVAEASSKEFGLKHGLLDLSVNSEVAVEQSAAQAQKVLAETSSARVRGCFRRFLEKILRGERVKGATPGPVAIQSGTPPAPGMDGSFGWRVTATFDVRGIKVPIYLDFLGFIDGPSEVTLLSSGLLRPFPAEVQQRLFALLLDRARTHTP